MPQKKNLLEAFTRSDAPAGSPSAPAPARESAPAVARLGGLASGLGGAVARPLWGVVAILLVGAFLLGYLVGRGSGGEALAGGGETPLVDPRPAPANQPRAFQVPPGEGPAVTQGALPAARGARIEESPLFDPANLHSVVVAAYSSSNQDLAWATYEHLRDAQLPVFPPIASGNLVVVLVGAAPTEGELTKTRDAVRRLERDGKKAYADAYLARIDKLIPRTNTKGNEEP